jgi:hypothetical protein
VYNLLKIWVPSAAKSQRPMLQLSRVHHLPLLVVQIQLSHRPRQLAQLQLRIWFL